MAKGLVNAIYDAEEGGDSEQSRALLEELIDLLARYQGETIEKLVQNAIMIYGNSLLSALKAGDAASAQEGMRWLKSRLPSGMAELLRPLMLVMDVLAKGEEQVLAREPEEVRRVVRIVLEKREK